MSRTVLVLILASMFLRGGPARAASECSMDAPGSACAQRNLTPKEERAVRLLRKAILQAGSMDRFLQKYEPRGFLKKAGIDAGTLDLERVRAATFNSLTAAAKGSFLKVRTRCDEYQACGLSRDLAGATGPLLAMYEKERKENGRSLTGTPAPEFSLPDLAGHPVSLSAYKGKRVALVFWGSHCDHSWHSLHLYEKLHRELASQNFALLTVLFVTGSREDINQWWPKQGYTFPVLHSPTEELADRYGTHLVPTVFLVDENGMLTRKLVGLQDSARIVTEVETFAHQGRGGKI